MEYLFLYFNYFSDYCHQSFLDFLTYLKHILLDFYLSISFWGELTTFKKSTHLCSWCVWLHRLLVAACRVFPPCCGPRGLPSLLWPVGSSILVLACRVFRLCCGVWGLPSLLWPAGPSLLAVASGVFTCSMWPLRCQTWDLVPWPRMEPRQPCLWSMEPLPLDHQESPVDWFCIFIIPRIIQPSYNHLVPREFLVSFLCFLHRQWCHLWTKTIYLPFG